jgi:hypothetical protein
MWPNLRRIAPYQWPFTARVSFIALAGALPWAVIYLSVPRVLAG